MGKANLRQKSYPETWHAKLYFDLILGGGGALSEGLYARVRVCELGASGSTQFWIVWPFVGFVRLYVLCKLLYAVRTVSVLVIQTSKRLMSDVFPILPCPSLCHARRKPRCKPIVVPKLIAPVGSVNSPFGGLPSCLDVRCDNLTRCHYRKLHTELFLT